MDELKNEWSHYFIDPILLKPYEKQIKEKLAKAKVIVKIESTTVGDNEDKTMDKNVEKIEKIEKIDDDTKGKKEENQEQEKEEYNSEILDSIVQEFLEDPDCHLPMKNLNDKVLKNIIIKEGIECLNSSEKEKKGKEKERKKGKKGKKDKNEKENSIDFIFVKEFKN